MPIRKGIGAFLLEINNRIIDLHIVNQRGREIGNENELVFEWECQALDCFTDLDELSFIIANH
jgi:hypothetical protein